MQVLRCQCGNCHGNRPRRSDSTARHRQCICACGNCCSGDGCSKARGYIRAVIAAHRREMPGYTITVENTGNVSLLEPDQIDSLTDANGVMRALTLGPDFISGDANGNLLQDVGEVWAYTALVVLTQAILDSGGLSNSIVADSQTRNGTPVADTSDDDNGATDGNGDTDPTNDPTATTFDRQPVLAALKSASLAPGPDRRASVGDVITYGYTVTNAGNVTVPDVTLPETGFSGAGRGLRRCPQFLAAGLQSAATAACPIFVPVTRSLIPCGRRTWTQAV